MGGPIIREVELLEQIRYRDFTGIFNQIFAVVVFQASRQPFDIFLKYAYHSKYKYCTVTWTEGIDQPSEMGAAKAPSPEKISMVGAFSHEIAIMHVPIFFNFLVYVSCTRCEWTVSSLSTSWGTADMGQRHRRRTFGQSVHLRMAECRFYSCFVHDFYHKSYTRSGNKRSVKHENM